ncbi:hypothetical protein [Peribacillus muralis]|uniref:hypothetical protein n=1 Tax=Peribacillus muralis TaxID=264697 RepID=UPI003CFC6442
MIFRLCFSNFQLVDLEKVLFKDLVVEWKKRYASSLAIRTQQGYESNLNLRVLPSFGHLKVSNIRKVHIQIFFDDLKRRWCEGRW